MDIGIGAYCVIGISLFVMFTITLWMAAELSRGEWEYWQYSDSGRVYDPTKQVDNPTEKGQLDGADLVCNKGDGKQIEKWTKKYGEKTT